MKEKVLNQKIEILRRELNDSIEGRDSLSELCDKSVQLDRLIAEYIQTGQEPVEK